MMDIERIPVNMLEENCYVVSDDTREAVVIDCGALSGEDRRRITDYVESRRLQVRHHLCTHMHYDHCFGAAFMWETFHAAPEFNKADEPIYKGMGAEVFGPLAQSMREGLAPSAARHLTEEDTVPFGHHVLTVLHTPGHTPGGICFYCAAEKAVFSGDTLFRCGVGRTDFPGGDGEALRESIEIKLFTLPEDTRVYPGHGPHTEIGYEKSHNPYMGYAGS